MSGPGESLPISDAHYRRLFDEVPLAYQSLDADGCLLEVNQAWLQLLGYKRDEVLGRPLHDFIPLAFLSEFKDNWQTMQAGHGPQTKVLEMVRRNGSRLMVEVHTRREPSRGDDPAVSFCLLRDITDQSRADREAGTLSRRLSMILESMPGAIVGYDQDGLVTFANPATERLTGWSPADLLGTHVHDRLHGRRADGEPVAAADCTICRAMARHETNGGKAWLLPRDGTPFPVEYQDQPQFAQGAGTGGVLSFNDITERFQAEERLRRSEDNFRHFFNNAPVALWHEDLSPVRAYLRQLTASGVTDLDAHFRAHPEDLFKCLALVRIIDVNQATLELHGAASLAELTDSFGKTMTDDAIALFRQELVALAKGQPGTQAMATVKTLGGELRHVMFKVFFAPEDDGRDSAYVAFMDLTETRQMEELNRRLVTAIEQTGDNIFITDREGTIVYCNPAFERVSGYTRAEALGCTPRLLKSGRHSAAFYQDLWDTITSGRTWTGHLINRHRNGEIFEEDGSISPVLDTSGQIVNFVSVKRDVTRQLDLERRLNQSQKMEAVGQLAGGIAHDFNNILHAMLGHLEFAADPATEREGLQRELVQLRASVDRAGQLTRQLLAFSRRQVLELKNADANDLIAQLLKMVRRVIGEDIKLDFRPGNLRHEIRVDAGQIEQVLLNLCLNARDAMPGGGTLLIETGLKDIDAAFVQAHIWAKPGQHVEISLRDTGTGIPPEVLNRIFEPFFTTKERGRGTGLGLATAYGTIKQHGGMILVDSTVGQGTTFTLLLPALEVTAPAVSSGEPEPDDLPGGTETILLAEDDQAVRQVVSRLLTRAGYQVLQARDGQHALEVAADHPGDIHLALLDLVMPALGGPQVAREIRQVRPALKILFNTGYSEDAIRGRIPADLQAPLLMKPHNPRDLLAAIRKLLDEKVN